MTSRGHFPRESPPSPTPPSSHQAVEPPSKPESRDVLKALMDRLVEEPGPSRTSHTEETSLTYPDTELNNSKHVKVIARLREI